jgi:hypothetical protein
MIESLKKLKQKNFDVIYCVSTDKNGVDVYGNYYGGEVIRLDESQLGSKYHIILFKEDRKGELYNVDMFEAILIDPLEYLSGLLPQGWFGVFFKKTTVSGTIAKVLFDKLTEK